MSKCANEISDQIMGQRPGRLDSLLFQRDRGGLGLADPDGR